jgi:hypothetical protein
LNNGDGTFAAAADYALKTPKAVAVGDYNGDGNQDILATNVYDSSVSVLLGDGTGALVKRNDYEVTSYPTSVLLADFDQDGDLDVAVAGGYCPTSRGALSVLLQSSTTGPTVTINQAAGQADPVTGGPINFTVVFSETVADFDAGDVTLSGSTAPGRLVATVTGSGTTYNVAVTGMMGAGTVVAGIGAGVAHDAVGNASAASASADNTVTVAIQTISNVKVNATNSAAKTSITWSAFDSNGLKSATLTIDGKSVKISKKASGKTGASYGYLGALAANTSSHPSYSYVITVTNVKGVSTTYAGTFTVAATTPVISKVKTKATTSDKAATISWNVADIDGVDKVTLKIDGVEVTSGIKKSGTSTSQTYTYSGYPGAGEHSFEITARDTVDVEASPYTSKFTVKATVPVIKKVKATAKTATDPVTITWTVFDFDGVGSTTLKIDGAPVTTGVTQSGSGTTITYTYTGAWGAGKHVFTIDAADASSAAVPAKQAKGSFTIKAPKASLAAAAILATTSDVGSLATVNGTVKTDWLIDYDSLV